MISFKIGPFTFFGGSVTLSNQVSGTRLILIYYLDLGVFLCVWMRGLLFQQCKPDDVGDGEVATIGLWFGCVSLWHVVGTDILFHLFNVEELGWGVVYFISVVTICTIQRVWLLSSKMISEYIAKNSHAQSHHNAAFTAPVVEPVSKRRVWTPPTKEFKRKLQVFVLQQRCVTTDKCLCNLYW